jgi:hypothetical protein
MVYHDIKYAGTDYILGFEAGAMYMWKLTGEQVTLTQETTGVTFPFDYIGTDMRMHVVDNKIVLLNREVTVEKSNALYLPGWRGALFHAVGGQFLKTYAVNLKWSDGAVVNVSYSTPDGTGASDGTKTSSEWIVTKLYDAVLAAPNLPSGTFVTRAYDVVSVNHPTQTITVGVSDGEGGEILRGVSSSVKDITDLPRYAPNGTIVRVATSKADEDDYWLKFKADGVTAENGTAGFGTEGIWFESHDHYEPTGFELHTMPHTLVPEGAGFKLTKGPWARRSVGDSGSAPFPSIVGNKLRDIDGFESRMALLSTDSVVMTRTNEPFDLWRESATVISATDPVDISSSKKDDLKLDWFVPFDRDMFIMADPGDSQFVIRGGGVDPSTASMVLTTEFEISSGNTPPVSTGRTILFPFSTGEYSGIKEFYTDSDNAANAANSLTETQDRYITGAVTGMAVSQNFNLALFRTDTNRKTVWVYKYLWDGGEILQSAWGKWVFNDRVEHMFFRNSQVYFICQDIDGGVFVQYMDLNRPLGEHGYHEMLDRRDVSTVSGSITLPYTGARFLQGIGCESPGLEVVPTTTVRTGPGTTVYTFDTETVPLGATLSYGINVPWSLTPTRVFAKDYQGRIDTSQKLTIQEYIIHVDQSGSFLAAGTSPYGDAWEYEAKEFPLDNEPLDLNRIGLHTGPYPIPWGERADWSELTLTGTDIRPVTIHEVEWIGQTLKSRGGRA